jgi:outer membrane receptor for ferrienterochelin and colicins
VRGPMSALYGADAMGGVVNIITRKFSKDWRGAISATAVRQTNDEVGHSQGVDFWLGGPIVADGLGLQVWGGSDRRGEDDFYVPANTTSGANSQRNKRIDLKLTARLDERQDLSFGLGAQRFSYLATPGLSIADTPTATTVVGARHTREHLGVTHDGRWGWGRSTMSVYQETGTQTQTLASGVSSVEPEVVTTIAEGRAVLPWGANVLTVGVQSNRQRLSGVAAQDAVPVGLPANPNTIARNGYALFGENDFALTDAFTLTTGARLDHDENYGNHVSPRVYGVYTLNPQWTLRGGVGSGFRAPTLRQSADGYCMTTGGAAGATPGTLCGNPELKPETSVTGELGARWDSKTHSASITLFNNRFKNRVASYDTGVPDPRVAGRNVYVYDNIARVDIAGIELAASSTVARGVQLSGNYTLTDSKRKGGGENAFDGSSLDGKPLDKTPKHKANVRAEWQALPALSVFGAIDYTGKQYWSAFRNGATTTREREATTTFDLGGRYAIARGVDLKLAVLNLTDERVDVDTRARAAGLNGNWMFDEGRRLSLTLSAEF